MRHTRHFSSGKIVIHWLFVSCLTSLFVQTACSQSPTDLNAWLRRIAQFGSVYPQENVYMQLDNSSYFAGETIYFKAWLTRADNREPSEISKVLYVDLIAPNGTIVDSRKFKIEYATAIGSLALYDTLSAAEYRLRAYTRWQQNFTADNLFCRVIPIYNVGKIYSLNFSQKFLPGKEMDTLNLKVALNDKARVPLKNTELSLKFSTSGFKWETQAAVTDEKGMADMQFILPTADKGRTAYITAIYKEGFRDWIETVNIPLMPEALSVQFMPEGGDCIIGLDNHIAFKAVDESNLPADIQGIVLENGTTPLLTFSSEHQGMGSFHLTPKKGSTYSTLVWFDKNGNAEKPANNTLQLKELSGRKCWCFNLPETKSSGYTLQCLRPDKDIMEIFLRRTPGMPEEELGLLIQQGGQLRLFNQIVVNSDSLYLYLPLKRLMAGINQLTLYKASGEPVAERLISVLHPSQNLNLAIRTNKFIYEKQEPIISTLSATDTAGNPVAGEFTLAVNDITNEEGPSPYNETLLSSLFLTSDLKGPVQHPGYYIQPGHERAADLLMLTQGWRRYVWKKQTGQELQKIAYPAEKGIIISGSVISLIRRKPVGDYELTLLLHQDSSLYADVTYTDSLGGFQFVCDFYGKRDLQLQTRKKETKKETRILLDRESAPTESMLFAKSNPWPEYKKNIENPANLTDSLSPKKRKKSITEDQQLPEVTVTAKSFHQQVVEKAVYSFNAEKVRDDLRDRGKGGFETDLKTGLYEMLCEQDTVHWLRSMKTEKNQLKDVLSYKGKPIILVNASWSQNEQNEVVPLDSEEGFSSPIDGGYTSNDIEKVLVVEDRQTLREYGDFAGNCSAVVFYYLYEDGRKRREPIGIRNTTFEGYSLVKEFYSPDYSQLGSIPDPDRRRTLYWNPSVRTDSTGTATVKFYNNDTAKQLVFTSEGFSEKATPGSNRIFLRKP